jgi:hypothetical protein
MESQQTLSDDLVTIVRNASLFNWLMRRGRSPERIPPQLHADLGLARPPHAPVWLEWRNLGESDR